MKAPACYSFQAMAAHMRLCILDPAEVPARKKVRHYRDRTYLWPRSLRGSGLSEVIGPVRLLVVVAALNHIVLPLLLSRFPVRWAAFGSAARRAQRGREVSEKEADVGEKRCASRAQEEASMLVLAGSLCSIAHEFAAMTHSTQH